MRFLPARQFYWRCPATSGQADFETRLRVDEYSHVRVVSELSNGELHMDSRYVKVSGGCSRHHPTVSIPN